MRIHFVVRSLRQEGAGSHQNAISQIRYLKESGHTVTVHAVSSFNNPPADIEVVAHGKEKFGLIESNRFLARLLSIHEKEVDVFFLYGVDFIWGAGRYRKDGGTVPVVVYLDTCLATMDTSQRPSTAYYLKRLVWEKMFGMPLAKWVDAYVASSPFIRDQYVHSGFPAGAFHIVSNFFEFNDGSVVHDDTRTGVAQLLYAGRLTHDKGTDLLIRAVKDIPMDTPWHLRIVGDGSLKEECKNLIQKYNLDESVEITPWVGQDELSEVYASADVFIHPSRCPEAFGRTFVEAMSRGIPVIASNIGAAPWTIGNGGILCSSGDIAGLREAIRTLIGDCGMRKQLGEEGRVRSLTFRKEVVAHRLAEVLESTGDMRKIAIALYEVGQISEVRAYLDRQHIPIAACTVIPLELEVERALRDRHIPYESFLEYVPIDEEFGEIVNVARSAPRRFHEHPAMRFYNYQGLNLGEVFEPMLDMYLEYLGRYVRIFKYIAEAGEFKKLYVPHSVRRYSLLGEPLALFEMTSPVDAAIAVGGKYGFSVEVIGVPPRLVSTSAIQHIVQCIEAMALAFYNAFVRLFVPPRLLKLYASEYWSHVESFIKKMDDVELVFMERSEIKNIPWRQLLKHRIRFLHPSDAIDANAQRNIAQAMQEFSKHWHMVKGEVRGVFDIAPGIDAWAAIEAALTYLVETESARALVDIEGLKCILQKEQPDKVLLRASIGGSLQHFYIATQVAHQFGIPSIELQHAGAIIDSRTVHSRLTASYLAAYGPLVGEVHRKNHGYAPERIRSIGSPRFDHYVHERDSLVNDRARTLSDIGLDPSKPTVFAAVPYPGAYPLLFNSYQVADFFNAFRTAQKEIPGLQCIFKFRSGCYTPLYRDHIRDVFADGGAVGTDTKDFLPLIVASDVACSGNSTLMFEIMLGERPMILFPWLKWDTHTLELYTRAAPAALDAGELTTLLRKLLDTNEAEKAVNRQNTFLAESYSFDGHAPERMADLLREKLLPLP